MQPKTASFYGNVYTFWYVIICVFQAFTEG